MLSLRSAVTDFGPLALVFFSLRLIIGHGARAQKRMAWQLVDEQIAEQ